MFKEKSSKKRIAVSDSAKDHATLDALHQQMIQSLQDKHTQLANLAEEKAELRAQMEDQQRAITDLKSVGEYDTQHYNSIWSSNIACRERIAVIDDIMKKQTECEDEIEYYENTGYILFKYYDCIRNQGADKGGEAAGGTTISGDTAAKSAPQQQQSRGSKGRGGKKGAVVVATRSILDAFQQRTPSSASLTIKEDEEYQAATPEMNDEEWAPASSSSLGIFTEPTPDKSVLVDEYMAYMDSNHLRPIQTDALGICLQCRHELVCIQQEGAMVCPECGYQELLLIEQNRPLMRQMSKEASHQSYKRINHFREWCSQVQGRESTDIPEEVFEQIMQEIKKEKISDPRRITYNKMREILKRLRYNKYYEHLAYITRRICNIETPHFSPELEDKLCSMFKEIQGSFVRHCPVQRKNFLSYSYVLFKFFQILGQQDHKYLDYCKHFMLLKSREKLYVQDQIFKAICEDLGWPVIPTL